MSYNGLTPELVRFLFPVVSITRYKNGAYEVNRKANFTNNNLGEVPRGDRGKIEYLSGRARTHLAFVVTATEVEFNSIITLTYPKIWPLNGLMVKAHLNLMLTWFRASFVNFSYVWVIEFQARGAPHIHILTSLHEPTDWRRKEFAHKWRCYAGDFRWAADLYDVAEILDAKRKMYNVHKHPRAWEALRDKDAASKYILKYCLKTTQKSVPAAYQNVGRFYGWSRDVKNSVEAEATLEISDDGLDLILEVLNHRTKDWPVKPKFIFGLDLGDDAW